MRSRIISATIFVSLIFMQGQSLMAQCSQCKVAAGTQSGDGSYNFGSINAAILYLLALPLVLPFIVGGVWYYRKKQAQKANA
ncbi:MAG: hypothetical protein AAFY71_14915 [Bacteroidota bacterium]